MSSPLFRFVVAAPVALGELLQLHGLLAALPAGRVFVGHKRVDVAALPLAGGAVVEIFAPRPSAQIEILQEVGGVVAVHKPAALPTEPDHSGSDCVLAQLAQLLRCEPRGLFAVSRLDVGVSGVLLVTLGAASRAELLASRAAGSLKRRYVAIASGVVSPGEGDWREALGRGGRGQRAVEGQQAQSAHSRYRAVATARAVVPGGPATSLLALSPVTGRTHQLRVHAAANGAPLLGDRKYAGPPRMTAPDGSVHAFAQILLHSAWVEWVSEQQEHRVTAEPVAELVDCWRALDGEHAALQRALD